MTKPSLLVSACLLGQPVRHDGGDKFLAHKALERWRGEGRLVSICPELAGGLPVPRPPAEIDTGFSGGDVLADRAAVRDHQGRDLSDAFIGGAMAAVDLAKEKGCAFALLKESSPSCGVLTIHAGHFDGTKSPGQGVTAALLRRHGVAVFSDEQIDDLIILMDS
ncbi:DUF523 domain-containing protein [Parvularcula sp. LCG005]|uniref:DUF523 domain-containing protein n=1 Tax=Parvularcula sp. LCG005 TaxID=3078805 RepID=UPI002942097B|nr:DUF523 domain-containing protein [Parvularcula sp. LCG005]WOI54699.1 DUF523 domain-containing protein [Parvularcula sp. LCG005]